MILVVTTCMGFMSTIWRQVTAKNFGTTNAGPNYGIVFTATIASGLLGAFYLKSHHPTTQDQWREVGHYRGRLP